jgi:hypothetical protein
MRQDSFVIARRPAWWVHAHRVATIERWDRDMCLVWQQRRHCAMQRAVGLHCAKEWEWREDTKSLGGKYRPLQTTNHFPVEVQQQ